VHFYQNVRFCFHKELHALRLNPRDQRYLADMSHRNGCNAEKKKKKQQQTKRKLLINKNTGF